MPLSGRPEITTGRAEWEGSTAELNSHVWQWPFEQALAMSETVLAAPKPDSGSGIPYFSLIRVDTCIRFVAACPRSHMAKLLIPGLWVQHAACPSAWPCWGPLFARPTLGQEDGEPHRFLMLGGSRDGLRVTTACNTRVDSTHCAALAPSAPSKDTGMGVGIETGVGARLRAQEMPTRPAGPLLMLPGLTG